MALLFDPVPKLREVGDSVEGLNVLFALAVATPVATFRIGLRID
jgi:hypothetical protein